MCEEAKDVVTDHNHQWRLCRSFEQPSLERLYQSYRQKQKRGGLAAFLAAVLLLNIWVILAAKNSFATVSGILGASLAIVLGVVEIVRGRCAPCHCWGSCVASVGAFLATVFYLPAAPPVLCPLIVVYLALAALPLRLRYGVLLALLTAILYGVAIQVFTEHEDSLVMQHISNGILLLAALILGLQAFILDDRQQRQAFLETRQSLEVKLVIEEQSAEQERLLLSVLPEHVAVKMRQDLGSTDTQFKKIYMSRHENVSILYADIVGFTAISSTYSAQELVAILNELFARFDRLSEKFHQLRIKILGDCYYCISGAPVERPDHAVVCVRMGLAMVKSIKYLQKTTNSPVDMRVGIHTGAILAGVLGQRQWQFDVYSRDVELANKMESSGMAGRVHISEKTLSFLDGEFEVEPAFGEKREEALRLAGIKTYFIVKELKPYQPDKADDSKSNNVNKNGDETSDVLVDVPSDTRDEGDSMKSPVEEEKEVPGIDKKDDSDEFNERLRKELVNRDGNKILSKHTGLMLGFQTQEMEMGYNKRDGIALAACFPLTLAVFLPAFILSAAVLIVVFYIAGIFWMISVVIPLAAIVTPYLISSIETDSKKLAAIGKKISHSVVLRILFVSTAVVLLTFQNAGQMWQCKSEVDKLGFCSEGVGCAYVGCSGGALIAIIGSLCPVPFIVRAILTVTAIVPPTIISFCCLGDILDCVDTNTDPCISTKFALCILMINIAFILITLSYHLEATNRVLFLWKAQIEEQKECAADMRRRNEALVYNVLPPHVAAHFMGNRRRQHNELYSQSYSEVGVLFASMPNFSEFYTEETVNNQGLECLRFLNEVISDFDALLEKSPYQDIIKIKTIGSSYMAATGLNSSRKVQPDDPVTVRWFHLSLLVEFALELTKVLQGINEQSFNHFVLKMGINHGPITAGVIGARKPHYDIWGNTVNVASRMESTGKAGCIQVTEETCNILKHFGYEFEQRGLVSVKGKGELMTYYLLGKNGSNKPPDTNSIQEQVMNRESNDKNIPVNESNIDAQASSMNNGLPKSPNGNAGAMNCNGVLPVSPSNKESRSTSEKAEGDEKFKLLTQEDSSNDLNIDARESDALLKK